MSGGYWDYFQYRVSSALEEIELDETPDEYCDYENLKRDILIMKHHLEMSKIYMHRLDWLLSGDDGNESYSSRLKEDLELYLKDLK